MDAVTFVVPGKPQGKARAKTYRNKNTGFTTTVTPENTLLYENLIKNCFMQNAQGVFFDRGIPVELKITAQFIPPMSTSKKKKAAMLAGEEYPLKKPDMDNIVKVVADALNGVAYHDDTQLAHVDAHKIYSETECIKVTVCKFK